MQQSISIGAAPAESTCAQVGSSDYWQASRIECLVFMRQIQRALPRPEGSTARIATASASHDFGTYREVVVYFDPADPVGTDYAFQVEREAPPSWDAIAQYELTWFHTQLAYQRAVAAGRLKIGRAHV